MLNGVLGMVALALDQMERIEIALVELDTVITGAGSMQEASVRNALCSATRVLNHQGLHFKNWQLMCELLGVESLC